MKLMYVICTFFFWNITILFDRAIVFPYKMYYYLSTKNGVNYMLNNIFIFLLLYKCKLFLPNSAALKNIIQFV